METFLPIISVLVFLQFVSCRDFYYGMFKQNDFLVAQDNVYKDRIPYRSVQADYGRVFQCSITYFRVVDRLGMPPGITTKVVRGGLGKKYIAIRMTSVFNLPISANIYVGCENKNPKPKKNIRKATTNGNKEEEPTEEAKEENITEAQEGEMEEPEGEAEETEAPEKEEEPEERIEEEVEKDKKGEEKEGKEEVEKEAEEETKEGPEKENEAIEEVEEEEENKVEEEAEKEAEEGEEEGAKKEEEAEPTE